MTEQLGAEQHVDPVGGMRKQIGAQAAEDDLEHRKGQQSDCQNVQRGHPMVHQHLVDDHLKKQRRDQCEQLQEERCRQNLEKESTVFDDRRKEPAEAEGPTALRVGQASGGEDQPAGPDRLECLTRQDTGTRLARVMDQHLVVPDTGQHDAPAVAGLRDCRQRGTWQSLPGRPDASHLQPQRLPGPQQFGFGQDGRGRT